jgi:hypothetical protein
VPYGERKGEAKLNTVRDGWRHLRFLLLASPNYLFTIPGGLLIALGIITLLAALPDQSIEIGSGEWQPIFAGGIFLSVGVNAVLLGFASRLYLTARGITNEDRTLRFYHRYLGFETFIAIGLLLAFLGLSLDIVLAFWQPTGVSVLGLMAIAQAMIITGANIGLVGALSSMLEGE